MKRLYSVLIIALIFMSGHDFVKPDITNKKLDLPEFHSIYVNSGYTVELKQTNDQEVSVSALTEIYNISTFEVKDGVLHVNVERKDDSKNKSVWEKIDDIKISPEMTLRISMRNIKQLHVNGSGQIISKNSIAANNLDLAVTGSGKLEIDVKGQQLKTTISGSGEMTLKGYANDNDIKMSGSGNLHAYNCDLKTANVMVSGSGLCEIIVTDNLDAKVLGSGKILHKGQTKNVVKTVYGRGEIDREY